MQVAASYDHLVFLCLSPDVKLEHVGMWVIITAITSTHHRRALLWYVDRACLTKTKYSDRFGAKRPVLGDDVLTYTTRLTTTIPSGRPCSNMQTEGPHHLLKVSHDTDDAMRHTWAILPVRSCYLHVCLAASHAVKRELAISALHLINAL